MAVNQLERNQPGSRKFSLIRIEKGFPPEIRIFPRARDEDRFSKRFLLPGVRELKPGMLQATRNAYDAFENYADEVSWGPKEAEIRDLLIEPTVRFLLAGNRVFLDEVGNPRPPRVLHAGCGTARELKFLTDLGFEGVGIDVSQPMMQRGKEKWRKDPNWRERPQPFVRMDMTEMGLAPDYFDLVLSDSGIRHIPTTEVPEVLRDFHRCLQEEGLLAVAFREGTGEVMATVDKVDGGTATRYSTTCSREDAEALVKEAGFDILEILDNSQMQRQYEISDRLLVIGRK